MVIVGAVVVIYEGFFVFFFRFFFVVFFCFGCLHLLLPCCCRRRSVRMVRRAEASLHLPASKKKTNEKEKDASGRMSANDWYIFFLPSLLIFLISFPSCSSITIYLFPLASHRRSPSFFLFHHVRLWKKLGKRKKKNSVNFGAVALTPPPSHLTPPPPSP